MTAVARPTPLPVTFAGTDERLLEALQAGRPGAWLAFYDRFAPYVLSVLKRIIGLDSELEDLMQEVFARALEGVGRIREADKLKPWLRSLTVFTARGTLKRRRWRQWVPLLKDEGEGEIPEAMAAEAPLEERRALMRVRWVLDRIPVDERIAFTLRYFEGLELTEVAATTGVSLSTAKRRIWRAESIFAEHVQREPELRGWANEGEGGRP